LTRDPLIDQMKIRISGCPNGCGQHHIADIGFHGAATRGDQKMFVPAYEAFLGGMYRGSQVRYGIRPRGKVPAKSLPDAVADMLTHYRDNHGPDELFTAYVDRVG